jgi:hypothetical protein
MILFSSAKEISQVLVRPRRCGARIFLIHSLHLAIRFLSTRPELDLSPLAVERTASTRNPGIMSVVFNVVRLVTASRYLFYPFYGPFYLSTSLQPTPTQLKPSSALSTSSVPQFRSPTPRL